MTRPKDPARYPRYLRDAVELLDKEPHRVVTIRCRDKADARTVVLEWNCFKAGAISYGWSAPIRFPELPAYSARARFADPNWVVDIRHVDYDPANDRRMTVSGQSVADLHQGLPTDIQEVAFHKQQPNVIRKDEDNGSA